MKVAQSCPTLCNPMDYTVHGILQARILEWVAFSFSRASSQPRDRTQVFHIAAVAAKSLHSCPTLCDPIHGSPPDSPIPGILQARTLEWITISFSNAWKWKVKVKSLSRVRLLQADSLPDEPQGKPYIGTAAAAAKSLHSCPTLCDLTEGSPPGSPVPGLLQARTLEWVAISFSNASKWKVKVKSLSRVWLFATSWTEAYQVPLSMGFSRQEYWSGVPLPSPYICIGVRKYI